MPGTREPRVSIVKCPQHDNFEEVKKAVRQAVELIGGMEAVVSPGDRVMLKPNLIFSADYKTGATTNSNVVFAVAELCREVGAKEIVVAEGSAIGTDTDRIFRELGFDVLAEQHKCRLVNLIKDEFTYVVNPMARIMRRIRVPRTFIESNVVINIPVMKTHDALGVTLGLKNMKGIIHQTDKKRFHKWGLSQAVVDLGHIAMPELTIMDGTVALEGVGPVVGKPVGLGLVLASAETLALDRVCLEIMGFTLEEIEYIRLAGEQGLGCTELERIIVAGERVETVKRPFERLSLDEGILKSLNIKLVACDACSGCNNVINAYIYGLYNEGRLEKLKDCTLLYGQNPEIPEGVSGELIRFGVCTRNLEESKGRYIPGCPPHPAHINSYLEGKGFEKE